MAAPRSSQDVPKQIGADHHLVPFGIFDHEHARCIDQIGMGFHFGIFLSQFRKDLVPENHGIIEGIALTDAGEAAVFLLASS